MTNNQTKCSIIFKKNAMQVGDDERMINYEWPYHYMSVRIWSYSGPHFPAFQVNTERYLVYSPNPGTYGPE